MATVTTESSPIYILKLSLNEAKFIKMLTQNTFHPTLEDEPVLEQKARHDIYHALDKAGV